MTNLAYLFLGGNQISDISALSGMTNLRSLWLFSNQISDISALSGLTNLTELHLHYNQISDISALSGLTNLTLLSLAQNQISDISALSGMTNMWSLGLFNNQISDISALSGMTNLAYLHLNYNQISDISALSGLTNLTRLWLFNNPLNVEAYCTYLPLIQENNPGANLLCDPNPYPPCEGPNNAPIADAGPNLAIASEDQNSTLIQGRASDPDSDALSYRWLEGENEFSAWQEVGTNGEAYLDLSTVSYFSIGIHSLILEVSDGQATSADGMILTVGNSAPHAAPIGGGVYQIFAPVTLGGEVLDFDGDTVTYEWLEGDDVLFIGVVPTIYGGDPVILPDHIIPDLSLGTHTLTLSVNDVVNEPVTSEITVEVVDTGVPTLAPVPNKSILWPPDHKMVDITIEANASDNSGDQVILSAVVISNEPEDGLGDVDKSPDWTEPVIDQDNGIVTLQLRAERSDSGVGRVYTITITATDESGNSSQSNVEIIVPHDKRKE